MNKEKKPTTNTGAAVVGNHNIKTAGSRGSVLLQDVWFHKDYPLIEGEVLELNRNPENYIAEVEQAAFNPAKVVPGLGFSHDRMLHGRLFSYGSSSHISPNHPSAWRVPPTTGITVLTAIITPRRGSFFRS